nr:MAG TPA: hypothetical protein [Caudoviricetes sp.]DAZ34500.1 MAG TPA: hypothetical protein [Caudoviricetes sp.]
MKFIHIDFIINLESYLLIFQFLNFLNIHTYLFRLCCSI